ncbi:hypothetical protein DNTS_001461 [Danionella cerebrum]|uniref:G-protein coupled receptors family 1 profile domain-containing protein n=1 Tax=Danionella cerebrum TaxID=2873325 RepID=A0A553R4E3_9TELE|nr:hypothetical protein DNTS_001461 [Danionella translucida]
MLTLNLTVPLAVDFSHPEDYFIIIFHILFATSSALLAGSVVIGILSTRALRSQNRFIFMLNTSISDTLTGCSVFYLGLFDVQEGFPSKNSTFYILPSFLGVNVFTFLFSQFDRYMAVSFPFFYNRFISRGFVIGSCMFCWVDVYLMITIQNVIPVVYAAQVYALSIIALLAGSVVIGILSTRALRSQNRFIFMLNTSISDTLTGCSVFYLGLFDVQEGLQVIVAVQVLMTIKLYMIARNQVNREPPSSEKDSKKESLRIIVYVVICFLVLWSPSFVNISVKYVTKKGLYFQNEATNLFAIMARFNAITTPALYLWGSPALRAAVWKTTWSKIFKKAIRVDSGRVKPRK